MPIRATTSLAIAGRALLRVELRPLKLHQRREIADLRELAFNHAMFFSFQAQMRADDHVGGERLGESAPLSAHTDDRSEWIALRGPLVGVTLSAGDEVRGATCCGSE